MSTSAPIELSTEEKLTFFKVALENMAENLFQLRDGMLLADMKITFALSLLEKLNPDLDFNNEWLAFQQEFIAKVEARQNVADVNSN